jgi:hypothetical protein
MEQPEEEKPVDYGSNPLFATRGPPDPLEAEVEAVVGNPARMEQAPAEDVQDIGPVASLAPEDLNARPAAALFEKLTREGLAKLAEVERKHRRPSDLYGAKYWAGYLEDARQKDPAAAQSIKTIWNLARLSERLDRQCRKLADVFAGAGAGVTRAEALRRVYSATWYPECPLYGLQLAAYERSLNTRESVRMYADVSLGIMPVAHVVHKPFGCNRNGVGYVWCDAEAGRRVRDYIASQKDTVADRAVAETRDRLRAAWALRAATSVCALNKGSAATKRPLPSLILPTGTVQALARCVAKFTAPLAVGGAVIPTEDPAELHDAIASCRAMYIRAALQSNADRVGLAATTRTLVSVLQATDGVFGFDRVRDHVLLATKDFQVLVNDWNAGGKTDDVAKHLVEVVEKYRIDDRIRGHLIDAFSDPTVHAAVEDACSRAVAIREAAARVHDEMQNTMKSLHARAFGPQPQRPLAKPELEQALASLIREAGPREAY